MKTIVMTLAEVRQRLNESEFEIIIDKRLPNNLGTHIVTIQGHVIDVYDSDKVVIQGKNREQITNILAQKTI
jgi:ribonuclease HIII